MKTKNILRTLLIAVTMLLGANNTLATETQLWSGTSTQGTNVATRDAFTNAKAGDVVRVYLSLQWNITFCNIGNGAVKMTNSNDNGYISSENSTITNGYIESGFTSAGIAVINDQWNGGFRISQNPHNLTITKVTLIDPNGNETKISDGTSNATLDIQKNLMAGVTANHKVRVYVTHNSWKLSFKTNSWGTVPLQNSNSNGEVTSSTASITNGSYVDCILNAASLSENAIMSQNNGGLTIVPEKVTLTKVILITSGSSTPTEVTHNVYFYTDDAKTDLWHSQEVVVGAEIQMPPSNPSKTGYIFSGWKDLPTYMPDYDVYTSAIWVEEIKNFHVYTSYDANYGSVTLSSSYPESGTTVTVTVAPAPGFYVSSISLSTGGTISGSNNTYTFTMPGQDVTVNVSFEAGDVSAVITSSSQLATFSSEYPLDFSNVTALKAYIVTSENNGYAVLERVTGTVAAQTGLVVYGRTADIPVSLSGTNYSSRNKLVAAISSTDVLGAGKYVLTEQGGTTVFSEVSTNTATVPAGHAYLNLGSASARTRQIIIKVGDDSTGISDIEAESGEQVIYNLRGQRVEKPTRGGIYIINGKKVLVK